MVNTLEMRYKNLRDAFRAADADLSGGLSREELESALHLWRISAQPRHLDDIMSDFDSNGDGSVSYAEFCEGLKPFTVRSQPVFGLDDRFVTERHRVDGNRVLLNDNLEHGSVTPQPFERRSPGRPDYKLLELPRGATPASPEKLMDHTSVLKDRIHDKYKKLADAFRAFDANHDGKLSAQELQMAVRYFNLPIPQEHVMQIVRLCDADADGGISYSEFAAVLKRKDALGR